MSYANILFSSDDGIARITLNRQDKLNAFNDAMHADIRDALSKRLRVGGSQRRVMLSHYGISCR